MLTNEGTGDCRENKSVPEVATMLRSLSGGLAAR